MEKLLAITIANTVKGRGTSSKTTYLDRFVTVLLDENGNPTAPKSRTEIIALISYDIAVETREQEMLATPDSGLEAFNLDSAEDLLIFAEINNKVKNQVAAAVSDSQNATALSYNAQYKDVWTVVKTAGKISLAPKVAAEVAEEVEA